MAERLGVVGSGLMGTGIAEVGARGGLDVVVVDVSRDLLERGRDRLTASLARAEAAGRLGDEAAGTVAGRVRWHTDLAVLEASDLVVEAVVERLDVKLEIFGRLGELLAPGALIATNTSSLPVTPLAATTRNPDRVLGLHFFNPAPQMPLVEIAATPVTSADALDRAEALMRGPFGKQPIRTADHAGFVVNRLLVPFLMAAARMHDARLATADDIDTGLRLGAGHPMGPLTLMDLVGLDTIVLVADALYAEHRDPGCLVPPGLRRMVEAGWTGRKSGRGYYQYRQPSGAS